MGLKNIRLLMFALAIFFFGWSLRNALDTEITFYDQARHAMNGVALLDMVRDGEIQHPVSYLRRYFAHLPALSMPYHPPLFPAIEALFYAVLGINPFAPRLAVALTVFGSVLLMFRVVYRLQGSATVAAATVIVFFSLPMSQRLAADVMLEMPALLCTLAALWFMTSLDDVWPKRDACLAGCFAAAAVWTKQVLFIGLVPLLLIVFRQRWRLFRSPGVWLFIFIYTLAVGGLAMLWAAAGLVGFSKGWAPIGVFDRMIRNFSFYTQTITREFGIALLLAAAVICALFFARNLRRTIVRKIPPIYVCWILACATVLLAVPAFDARYLWFAYPALLAILFGVAQIGAELFLNPAHVRIVIFASAVAFCLTNLRIPAPHLTGPESAARYVLKAGAERVLYCGASNGSFIFAARSISPDRRIAVFRADKIAAVLGGDSVDAFTARYGIRFVVIEQNAVSQACERLLAQSGALGPPEQVIGMSSDQPAWTGNLQILRQIKAVPNPSKTIEMPFMGSGETLQLELEQR